ncbi:hypothetical protein W97_01631 [Coniosporium apollinis CBS 100218]|uniref:Uncharacterized protein n=1 Tax=Coniosporium apollinis (strain CBS 100218) TaxID=1168221 RepID=R7YKR8_CONA1|nr:uncharacterized protein W97_01631 [Coniosporium apollinis CBS 100218]EON62409.1 hypothetical protein W97_01631 [Coniosporium apollinis CBS 100218]
MTSSPYRTTRNPPLSASRLQEIGADVKYYPRPTDEAGWGEEEAGTWLSHADRLLEQCQFLAGKIEAQKQRAAAKDEEVKRISSDNKSLEAQNKSMEEQIKSMKEQIKSLQEKVRALEKTVPEVLPTQSERVEGVGSAPGAKKNRDTEKSDPQSLKKRKPNDG